MLKIDQMKKLMLMAGLLSVLVSCAGTGEAPDGMVRIPGGTFNMGSETGYSEEMPVHKVKIKAFYMDEKPVTNAQYKAFCDATGRGYPGSPRWKDLPGSFLACPDHPVINVSWQDAKDYAAWAGKRLPTEEEWEWAARGGLRNAIYPWGNEAPSGDKLNFADKRCEKSWRDNVEDDGWCYTSPVGIYPPNGYGLYDMAGNVSEWVEDWFFAYDDTVRDTEAFKDGWGGSKICRGGNFLSIPRDVTVSRRRKARSLNESIGFRCVKDIEEEKKEDETPAAAPASNAGWQDELLKMNVSIPKGTELCIGIGDTASPLLLKQLRCMGATSVEQYVTWETCENAGEGQWDWSHWDAEVEKIRAAGLKWLPFLIAGPAYCLPDWYRESREFEGIVCLEHNMESKIQSFWDKNFYYYIDRFLKAFADHYKDTDIFEGLLFGISGDYGEAIVSVSGNWTQNIPGRYHAHAGYWCQDRFARADFKDWAKEKFGGDIALLNERWGTAFPSFAAVDFPPLEPDPDNFRIDEPADAGRFIPSNASERRRWIDFIDWYRKSMTDYASFWMKTARKYFPHTELYLCTGGDAVPWHASEFAQQSKISAEVGGGVRITNEASRYKANFNITNWVASASTFYNGYFSFEPAGQVTERGVVCRVYNAAATGAKSLHYYNGHINGNKERAENFASNAHFLREGGIVRNIGVLYPDTPMVLDTRRYGEMNAAFALLRDYMDYIYVCDLTIEDGILDGLKAVVIPLDGYYKRATLEKIREFAANGGMVIGVGLKELRDLDNEDDYLEILFGDGHKGRTLLLKDSLSGDVEASNTASNYVISFSDTSGMQTEILDKMTEFFRDGGIQIADGILDDIFVADRGNALLIMNYSGKDAARNFTYPDGTVFKAEVPDLAIIETAY